MTGAAGNLSVAISAGGKPGRKHGGLRHGSSGLTLCHITPSKSRAAWRTSRRLMRYDASSTSAIGAAVGAAVGRTVGVVDRGKPGFAGRDVQTRVRLGLALDLTMDRSARDHAEAVDADAVEARLVIPEQARRARPRRAATGCRRSNRRCAARAM